MSTSTLFECQQRRCTHPNVNIYTLQKATLPPDPQTPRHRPPDTDTEPEREREKQRERPDKARCISSLGWLTFTTSSASWYHHTLPQYCDVP
eukprot:3662768-Rhodomonas_salina.1